MQALSHRIYRFDNLELDVFKRQLFRRGQPITLQSKAFDLLQALVENGGRLFAHLLEDLESYEGLRRDVTARCGRLGTPAFYAFAVSDRGWTRVKSVESGIIMLPKPADDSVEAVRARGRGHLLLFSLRPGALVVRKTK